MGKLNKDFKKKWLDSLRGKRKFKGKKFTKTKGKLKDRHGHCCLGVACELIDPTKWLFDDLYFGENMDNSRMQIPQSIAKKYNISNNQQIILSDLNDDNPDWKCVIRYISRNM